MLPGVVSDLLRPYHNDWLGDVLLIVYFTLRGFEPKEMYRVWRTGALIEDFENFDSYDSDLDEPTAGDAAALAAQTKKAAAQAALHPGLAPSAAGQPPAAKKVIDVIVPTSLAQANRQSATAAGKGKLSQLLSKERSAMQTNLSTVGSSRFRGVYQRTVAPATTLPAVRANTAGPGSTQPAINSALDHILGPAAPAANVPANPLAPRAPAASTTSTGAAAAAAQDSAETVDAEGAVVCHTQVAKILRNPFAQTGAVIPQAQAKRNKKNLTFALVSVTDRVTSLSSLHWTNADFLLTTPHRYRTPP